MPTDDGEDARRAAERAARLSYGKFVAYLAARNRDVAVAEDALADAFTEALRHWPDRGTPANPEGWLLAVARRKLVDAARRRQTGADAVPHLRLLAEEAADAEKAMEIPDERLGLMFACAHPAIDPAIRAPLILQTILGLDAASIGSAFLVSPAAMGQRLARAKGKIRDAGIPLAIPERSELGDRLAPVLAAIYAAFAGGWLDQSDGRGRGLAEEAIWLGRVVVSTLPDEPEALGLLSLMLHSDARRAARRDGGAYVPLTEQDTTLWDGALIDEANALLQRAGRLGRIGRYQLEAAVQSAHAVRRHTGHANWSAIERLYDALATLTDSPVVTINRAIAVAEVHGPAAGLAMFASLDADPRLADYQPYWAARASLLGRSGDLAAADQAYERAISLEADPAVRAFLKQQRAALADRRH